MRGVGKTYSMLMFAITLASENPIAVTIVAASNAQRQELKATLERLQAPHSIIVEVFDSVKHDPVTETVRGREGVVLFDHFATAKYIAELNQQLNKALATLELKQGTLKRIKDLLLC
jgi:Rad3-related DNA helicase